MPENIITHRNHKVNSAIAEWRRCLTHTGNNDQVIPAWTEDPIPLICDAKQSWKEQLQPLIRVPGRLCVHLKEKDNTIFREGFLLGCNATVLALEQIFCQFSQV